jgi:hypothetical protein
MELIEQIREKCVAVNPEIVERNGLPETWCRNHGGAMRNHSEPCTCIGLIRLADVLLALKGPQDKWIKNSDKFRSHGWDVVRAWDLTKDDLTQQSEETVEFIAGIMNITS